MMGATFLLAAAGGEVVLAYGGDSSGGMGFFGLLLFLAGPAAGIGTYYAIYRRYRNAGAHYRYTTTTDAKVQDPRGRDDVRGSRHGARHARMHGDNRGSERQRLSSSRVEF